MSKNRVDVGGEGGAEDRVDVVGGSENRVDGAGGVSENRWML